MSSIKFSIITLTWNSEQTISSTVDSIINQDYDHWEHIIIDNVSTDETLSIVKSLYHKSFPLNEKSPIIISEKDKGISDGFNKGINAANGDVLIFLNSDDIYLNNSLLSDVSKAFEDPEIMYVHGDMIFEDNEFGTNLRKPLLCSLEKAMPYNHPTFFVRKELYQTHGFFNLDFKYTMDFEFICRLYDSPQTGQYKSIYFQSYPVVKMRAGGVSWSHELKSLDELKRALKKYNFYSIKAFYYLSARKIRIKLRKILSALNLNIVIKIWRKIKWS